MGKWDGRAPSQAPAATAGQMRGGDQSNGRAWRLPALIFCGASSSRVMIDCTAAQLPSDVRGEQDCEINHVMTSGRVRDDANLISSPGAAWPMTVGKSV